MSLFLCFGIIHFMIRALTMKKITLTFLFFQICNAAFNQVAIGTNSPVASAKLQVDATNKGLLPPRVTLTGTADVSTIATPATGLLVYNTATAGSGATAVTPGIYYYDGAKWQRVINQQPDATIEFNTADPNSTSPVPTFTPSTPASKDYVYVSSVDNSQWTYNGTAYVTYTPPASTAWYTAASTKDAGSNKTGSVYRTGNLGIGDFSAAAPGNKLEIKSTTSNTSGLKFTNLTSSTPTSSGATLGVDASGNVVTVNGSSFSPVFGTANPSGAINVSSGSSALLTSINITTTGTYLINYTMRVQALTAAANQYAVGFLSLDNSTAITGTEILGAFPGGATVGAPGGNYSGSHVITINTVPTTIYFRAFAQNGDMGFLDDGNGRTKISFVKVTP